MMLLRQLSFVWKSHFFRHCVAFKEVSRESKKVTKEMTSSCGETILPTILSRYQLCDIYNADEFGLLCKILSSKTLHFKGQCCSEGKHSKKRSLKWLHLTPLVRKHQFLWSVSLLSQDFSSMHEISLVDTKHKKKAWMDGTICEEWLCELDRKFERQRWNISMTVDNCPAPSEIKGLKSVVLDTKYRILYSSYGPRIDTACCFLCITN